VKLKNVLHKAATSRGRRANGLDAEMRDGQTRDDQTRDGETGVRRIARDGRVGPEEELSGVHVPRDSWVAATPPSGDRHSAVVERAMSVQPDAERATTLVIMEAGARWPVWVKELQRRAPNSMVEVQPSSESIDGFAARVLRRVQSIEERGVALVGVVYAAASPATTPELRVRHELCAALLERLSPEGELVLSGACWSTWGVDARSREELMVLAGDLACELEGRSQTVSVRFSDPIEESGVHNAVDLPGLRRGAYGRSARESA